MYSLIGKKVEGNKITGLRFIDLTTKETLDVGYSVVRDFMLNNNIVNAIYDEGKIKLRWQNIYHIPTIREDGSVSTYLFKVLINRTSEQVWQVANVMGTVVNVIASNLLSSFDREVYSAIIKTYDRIVKFTMKLDGTYETKQVTQDMIGYVDEKYVASSGGNSNSKLAYVDCGYERCYYMGDVSKGAIIYALGSFRDRSLTYLKSNFTKYKVMTEFCKNKVDQYPYSIKNKFSINYSTDLFVGIDGITFISSESAFNQYNENGIKEIYSRMLALDPISASILQDGLQVGAANDLLSCNLAVCAIPDGTEKVLDNSLYFNYTKYRDRYYEDKRDGRLDIFIPRSVKQFSNLAFTDGGASAYSLSKVYKNANIIVENPDIAESVINALLEYNIIFGSVKVDGKVRLTDSLVSRVYKTLDKRNLFADNLQIKKVVKKAVDDMFNKELEGYAIKPYINKCHRDIYTIVILESQADFESVYMKTIKNLKARYEEFKSKYATKVFNTNYLWTNKEYEEVYSKVSNLYFDYKAYSDMLMHTAVKEGDSALYKKLVDSAYKRREYLYAIMNEKLLVVAVKYGYKHKAN